MFHETWLKFAKSSMYYVNAGKKQFVESFRQKVKF